MLNIGEAAAPWRVEQSVLPIAGESLDGFIARAAAYNWIDNSLAITNLGGVTYGHKPTLSTHGWAGLPVVADCLRVPLTELQQRSYPALGEDDRRLFFGIEVDRIDIETRTRRFAPGAFKISPHHRALWQLRPFPFCSETWEYLTDRCPRCHSSQRWYHANGIDRCDHCVEDLSRALTEEVLPELRPALTSVIGLMHFDQEVRTRTLLTLPDELRALGPSGVYELLIRLMPVAEPALSRVRRGSTSSWSAAPALITSALATAWPLVQGWPFALKDFMGERSAGARSRHNDGNKGRSLHFLNLSRSGKIEGAVADTIAGLRQSLDLLGPEGARLEAETMSIKETVKVIGEGAREVAAIRRQGGLKSVFALKHDRPVARFDREELRAIRSLIEHRVSLNAAAWQLGISLHGIEQLVAMKMLETTADPYCMIRYGALQTTDEAVRNLFDRVRLAAQVGGAHSPLSLRTAARVVGGRMKPWGPVFRALLGGDIPFTLAEKDRPLSQRIFVDREALSLIIALSFDASKFANFSFDTSMTRVDAGEVLNLEAKAYTPALHALAISGKRVAVADVCRLAEAHMSSTEFGIRLGISPKSAHHLAKRSGIPLLGPAGWCRKGIARLLPSAGN